MIIAQTFASGPSPTLILLVVLVTVLVVLVIARRFGWLPARRTLPNSARLGNRTARLAEAIVLLCVAAAIFVFTATNTSTGGRLLTLNQLRPGFATINVVVAAIAGVGVLTGVLATLFRRTSTGVVIAGTILCAYGFVLNGPRIILESLAPRESSVPQGTLVFNLSSPPYVEGAELYVDGVCLGTLPCEISYDEFCGRVPFWENEPNENMRKNSQSWLHVLDYCPSGDSGLLYRPWTEITVPIPSTLRSGGRGTGARRITLV